MKQNTDFNEFKSQVADFYDRRSDNYDDGKLPALIGQHLFESISVKAGQTVLDIGTGTGALAILASSVVGDQGKVFGIDIAPQMLQKAQSKADALKLKNVEFSLIDAEKLDYPSETFDFILCANTFPWIQNKASALKLWHTLLKPGGVIAVHTPAALAYTGTFVLRRIFAQYGISLEVGNRLGSEEQCHQLFADSGFQNIEIKSEQHGCYVPRENLQRTWEAVVETPSITSPKILNKDLSQLNPALLRQIKADFFNALVQLETSQGIWDDLTTLYVLGHKDERSTS